MGNGSRGAMKVWGTTLLCLEKYANFEGKGGKDQWKTTAATIGSFSANGYGLYDMAGMILSIQPITKTKPGRTKAGVNSSFTCGRLGLTEAATCVLPTVIIRHP